MLPLRRTLVRSDYILSFYRSEDLSEAVTKSDNNIL